MNGIDLSRAIMNKNKNQKVIIVSAYNETEYFIELINIGVSGFMQKPLTTVQMLDILYNVCLELEAELQSYRYIKLDKSYVWDKELRTLECDAKAIPLTVNEKLILELFIGNMNQVFSDLEIYNHIYYDDLEKEFSSNAIKSLLKRLRKKLPEDIVKTHKNLGYSLNVL